MRTMLPKIKMTLEMRGFGLPGNFFLASYQQATVSTDPTPHSAMRHYFISSFIKFSKKLIQCKFPLVTIFDSAGGLVLQAESECPRCRQPGIPKQTLYPQENIFNQVGSGSFIFCKLWHLIIKHQNSPHLSLIFSGHKHFVGLLYPLLRFVLVIFAFQVLVFFAGTVLWVLRGQM